MTEPSPEQEPAPPLALGDLHLVPDQTVDDTDSALGREARAEMCAWLQAM